ncbi:hypothetical protein [Acinetobacter larvae]|uniref:hypothetical protein n=1 Tax=Acinetobacter larvae TaxID=1789224 RepID=UPI0012FDF839|nr:hypothetical protein [Acinetobacter larvae]
MNTHLVIVLVYSGVLVMLSTLHWSHATCPQGLTYLNIPSKAGKIGACVQATPQHPTARSVNKGVYPSPTNRLNSNNPTIFAQRQHRDVITTQQISNEPPQDHTTDNRHSTISRLPIAHSTKPHP